MKTAKERNLNLDLIRCLALLMVPIMHSLDHTGLYDQQLYGTANQFMIAVKTLFTTCIPLYVLLSGFLNNRKALSGHSMLPRQVMFPVCFIYMSNRTASWLSRLK